MNVKYRRVIKVLVPCCDAGYDFHIKTMFGSSFPPVVCRGAHVLFMLFVYSGVQLILCCVFVLFFFVLCTLCCQFLWIVLILLPLSVFSNVYIALDINPSTIRIKYHNIYRSIEMSIVITRKSQ